jgi:hypothetical protein
VRASLARLVAEAAEFLAGRGTVQEGAPLLIRLMTAVTSRFGVVVSEKALAEMVPLIGALGGALINLLFISHFQAMASGHLSSGGWSENMIGRRSEGNISGWPV